MIDYLLSMLMLIFAIASIIVGIFSAYFGSGKGKVVGAIFIIIGLIIGALFLWFAGVLPLGGAPISWAGKEVVINGIIAVIGAIIGASIALGMFLLAITKA